MDKVSKRCRLSSRPSLREPEICRLPVIRHGPSFRLLCGRVSEWRKGDRPSFLGWQVELGLYIGCLDGRWRDAQLRDAKTNVLNILMKTTFDAH
jgi:hypothetical protein